MGFCLSGKKRKNSFECWGKGMAGRNGEKERKCFLMNKEEKVYVVYKNGKKEILWKLQIYERDIYGFETLWINKNKDNFHYWRYNCQIDLLYF
ncbi:unnamed protein product [Meloidogyne enterolobii]|uniref:Uncharacterized protein n=1 Tax=Meloidogyne enterolobii TaxID=390850 RepID=A0ACB1AD34_MELEN